MYFYDFDGASLRQDLLDYYGTAAFNGFPAAMMDVFAVERMDDNQLWAQAEKNGFTMDKYISNYGYSTVGSQASYFTSIPYVSFCSTTEKSRSEEELHFPVYSQAVKNSFYEISNEAQSISKRLQPGWEYELLRQEVNDFSYQLGKLKKQTLDNPFVSAIGKESNGRNLLFYIVAMADNLSDGISHAQNVASTCLKNLDSNLNLAKRRKDPNIVRDEAVKLMEPYCIFLGMYNDLMLIEQPQDYKVIFSEYKKILKSMLSDCEMFYFHIYSPDKVPSERSQINQVESSLDLHGFYTKKISDAVLKNREELNKCIVQRRTL